MGFEVVGVVLVCFFIGQWIDTHWQLNGIASAAGPFVGIGLWIFHLLMVQKKLEG